LTITVFYSWQNDTNPTCNRYLIRDAAEKAIKALNQEILFESSPRPEPVVLDHDTKDTPGHPEIVNTILEKIRNCDIFLADLTFVGSSRGHKAKGQKSPKTKSRAKLLPNPNVMFEVGYAFNVLNDSRFIFVQNTNYGDPDKRVFDLAHRRDPWTYALSPDHDAEQRKQAEKYLSDRIKLALKSILKGGVLDEKREAVERSQAAVRNRIEKARLDFHRDVRDRRFLRQYEGEPVWTLGIFPSDRPDRPIDWKMQNTKIEKGLRPLRAGGCGYRLTGVYLEAFHMSGRDTGKALTRIDRFGTILAASIERPVVHSVGNNASTGEEIRAIAMEGITRETIETVHRWVAMFYDIDINGPWFVETSLLNLPRCRIPWTKKYARVGMDKEFAGGDIVPDLLLIPENAHEMETKEFARLFVPLFDLVWQHFDCDESYDFDPSGYWID